MASTKAGSRLRVLVPQLTFVQRGTITRLLRKEGMEVIPSVPSSRDLVRVVGSERPDVVVLDTETIRKAGAETIPAIREATPTTKVVLMTEGPATAEQKALGADATIRAGAKVAAVSGLLLDLCAEPTIVLPESEVLSGPTPVARPAPVPAVLPAARQDRRRARLLPPALVAVGVALVLVFSVVGILSGDGESTTTSAGPGGVVSAGAGTAPAETAMEQARATLADLVGALEAGRYADARFDARQLMLQRQAVELVGFSLFGLDEDITAALRPFATTLPSSFCLALAGLLVDLMPACQAAPAGGGGDVLVLPSGTSGPAAGGGGGGKGEGGEGGSGAGTGQRSFPGNGNHGGWDHKPPHGGWHGGPPPWAHGNKQIVAPSKDDLGRSWMALGCAC